MNRIASHSMLLPAPPSGAGAVAPEWIHLLPAGTFKGVDGRGPYSVASAASLIAASKSNLPLTVDENHSTDLAAPLGHPAPARGRVEELAAREDGIWGRVIWNSAGEALLAERAYRHISPVFIHAANGQVRQLLRASLTNVPNLKQLTALNQQETATMDLLAELRQLHGLPADADEATALNACRTAHQAVEAHGVALNAIATAAGLSAGQDATALAAAITSARTAAGETGRMAAELVSLQSQLNAMNAEKARARAEAAVDGAIREGKPIPKTLREHYIARHCQDAASVETELAGLPALNAGGIKPRVEAGADNTDPVQLAMNAQAFQDKERAAGREINMAEAVQRVVAGAAG